MVGNKLETELRVVSAEIKTLEIHQGRDSEVILVKAVGGWFDKDPHPPGVFPYPVSLHITVYPGCGVIPATGDRIKITIERID